MAIATGTVLVLLSWTVMLAAAVGVGLLPALLLSGGRWGSDVVRVALWWGLALVAVLITSVSLVLPLRDARAAALIVGICLVTALTGALAARAAARGRRAPVHRPPRWWWLLVAGLGSGVLYLAVAALGPVTNYDSGLYHLGAIAYAGDYAAIPGLANLYFPFGYANAHFPVAAFLGNGPWDGIGYRLLNGALLTAMALDLALRARHGRLGPGFYILAVGLAAAFVPMVALSDYWVTSPTSDSAVLVLGIVSCAYLADAAAGAHRAGSSGAVAFATAVLTVMLRPTMVVFAATTALVVVVLVLRARRSGTRTWPAVVLPAVFALVAAIVISARDAVLSGWLQYPLSFMPLDVPWRAAEPTLFRVPTLGAARDPDDLWAAAEGWEWVAPWLRRLPDQWEPFQFGLLVLVAVALLVVAARSHASLRGRALALVMAPSVAAVVFWWVATPPAFRFIWGPLFAVAAIPAGWSLWRLALPTAASSATRDRVRWVTAIGVAVPVLAVVAFSAVVRFDRSGLTEERMWSLGFGIPYAVAPVVDAPVEERTLASGLTVLFPTQSDQCWTNYPLCTAQLAGSVSLRGEGLQEGFLP